MTFTGEFYESHRYENIEFSEFSFRKAIDTGNCDIQTGWIEIDKFYN